MWLVRNTLKGTLSFRGLDVSIPAGEQFDLDVLGRDAAEASNQLLVALEEGYLSNVYKGAAQAAPAGSGSGSGEIAAAGLSAEQFEERMLEFKSAFIDELKTQLSGLPLDAAQSGAQNQALSADVRALVDEVKLMRQRFESERGRVAQDSSLSDGEIKARLAFLEEKERELLKNFETVGKRVEQDDGDVMDKADLLAGL
jgi:hypothetical protein